MEGVGEGVGDGRCKEGLVGGRLPGSHSAPAGRNGRALGWAKIQMLKKGETLEYKYFVLLLLFCRYIPREVHLALQHSLQVHTKT